MLQTEQSAILSVTGTTLRSNLPLEILFNFTFLFHFLKDLQARIGVGSEIYVLRRTRFLVLCSELPEQ